jgi:endonuclease/exonuclease/phosphatase family metal-dependent hydrolase
MTTLSISTIILCLLVNSGNLVFHENINNWIRNYKRRLVMRLASFNVENMFERPSIMNLSTWEEGGQVLQDFADLSNLIQKQQYSQSDKDKILEIMKRHKGLIMTGESKHIRLNEIRGRLLKKRQDAPVEIGVNGRHDWIGWFELKRETIKEAAIENTARVISEVNSDILCMVEVESRIAANRFNDSVIPKVGSQKYDHVMLIDGNDDRGIDVGVMTRQSFDIKSIVSHVDDTDAQGKIFSRDCAEYEITTPSGIKLLVLVNHFKSKGFGSQQENDAKRRRQAKRVREIYEKRSNEGFEFIAVAGDLNDTPEREPLRPLLGEGSNLIDIMQHPNFTGDGREGTHANGTKDGKLDYVLMSPQLASRVRAGGIERRGVWGGKNGDLFPHFPEIKTAKDAASDHAALWVELNL